MSSGYRAPKNSMQDTYNGQQGYGYVLAQDPLQPPLGLPFSQQPQGMGDQHSGHHYNAQGMASPAGDNSSTSRLPMHAAHGSQQQQRPHQYDYGSASGRAPPLDYTSNEAQRAGTRHAFAPAATPRQRVEPHSSGHRQESPVLPSLTTSAGSQGFSNLFQQLEAEMDQIQAKHSPLSSPIVPGEALRQRPHQEPDLAPSLQARHSALNTSMHAEASLGQSSHYLPRRQDSDNTVRNGESQMSSKAAYGGSGIISMYDPRIPSPMPDQQARYLPNPNQDAQAQPQASGHAPFPAMESIQGYGSRPMHQAHSAQLYDGRSPQETVTGFSGPSTGYPVVQSREAQRKTASSEPHRPARRVPSASGSLTSTTPSLRSVQSASSASQRQPRGSRPLPNSPATEAQPIPLRPTRSSSDTHHRSVRGPRPSQESNLSSSYRSFHQGSPEVESGIVPPRPSLSSSAGSRPSTGFSDNAFTRHQMQPYAHGVIMEDSQDVLDHGATYSPDTIIEDDHLASRGKQSDFSREFYASGGLVPDSIKYPNGRPLRKDSQRHEQAARPESAQATTSSPDLRHRGTLPGAHALSLNTASAAGDALHTSTTNRLRNQPTMSHSQSDPIAPHSRGYSASHSGHSFQPLPTDDSAGATQLRQPRQSNGPAARSQSFSAALAHPNIAGTRRNASLSGPASRQTSTRRQQAMQPAQPSPPLPSSPSISISASVPDTSYMSTNSYISSAPSHSSAYGSAMQKQPSLSPSQFSLSADGFVSTRRVMERERQRMESLGLQYLNPALLSNISSAFKSRIERGVNVKGSVPYPSSFTGQQAVSCLAEMLPYPYTDNRRIANLVARTLHQNRFFHEVEWDDSRQLRDSQEQVFCFADDEEQATLEYFDRQMQRSTDYGALTRAQGASQRLQEDLPNGVITRFTKCYSPFCGQEGTSGVGACYSLYCPNGAHPVRSPKSSSRFIISNSCSLQLGLQRKKSSISLATTSEEQAPEAWASTVPAELLEQLGPKEVARQNVIFEIITGEQAYKKDLDMLETAFAEPLRSAHPAIVSSKRLPSFLNQVFANLDELRNLSGRLVNSFQVRQREQNPVVQSIGDLVLDAALEWGQAYMDYAEAQVMGEYLVNAEKNTNGAFAAFLQSRREAFGIKQEFRHYHLRATIRLQRYLLPLAEYVKRTPEDHPDRETTQEAMRIIRQQCDACNTVVASAQLKLACLQYDKLIERDINFVNDLDLLNPSRQLFHHGKMFAKPEGARSDWVEYQVMLFDHYLVIAKPRRTMEGYRLIRRPIRLEMFTTGGWDDAPLHRTAGSLLGSVIRTGERRDANAAISGDRNESRMWPIAFRISGRLSGVLTLFVETTKNDKDGAARREWKSKLEEAAAIGRVALEANPIFQLNLLVDPDNRRHSATNAGAGLPSIGKILTSCPFVGPGGQKLVAIGTSTGLFIAVRHMPATLRQILQISIQSCAVLQEFGIFLVHTEGRLLSYLLDTLVQSANSEAKGQQGPQQVSGQKDILFFKVGRVGPRTLVVYAKKDGVNSTVLKAMEPVANIERSRVQHSRFLGMGGKKTEWFRLFKDAAVPTEVYGLTFTRSKLALVCAPGFEILDIDTLKTGSFPDWTAVRSDPVKFDAQLALLQRRCMDSRAVGLFRISDSEFLFCYEDLAFFADRHGDPLRERFGDMIEWEGRPDTVVFCKPYIIAFDSRFVEVRDTAQRGKLVQVIRGMNIRCTYDGQGLASTDVDVRVGGSRETDERLPHFVLRENNVDRLYELSPRGS